MAERYRNKLDLFEVEANQLTQENAEAVTLWCNGFFVLEHDALSDKTYPAINVTCGSVGYVKRAPEGSWIIKHNSGVFDVYFPIDFEHNFEHV